jgi:hypothetical protein
MKSMSFKDKFEKQVVQSINSNEEVRDAINNVVESRFDRVLEELRADREENARKWEENQKEIREMLAKLGKFELDQQKVKNLFSETVGSLGSRWGTRSEKSFRNALKGILEEATPYKVQRVIEDDDSGVVFAHPSEIELDVVIQNGKFFIVEIKSSVSAGDVAAFIRKAQFYERRHNKKANALMIISPMIDEKARELIDTFGIIAYSYASDVEPGILD